MRTLVAVDPGKELAGVAYFRDDTLVAAALIRPDPATPYWVARFVAEWVQREVKEPLDAILCEAQQIYPGPRKADPNDLLPLAYVAGAVQARINAGQYGLVLPRVWTGGVPKDVRVRKVLNELTPEETDVFNEVAGPKGKMHNVVDAIGIGLFALKRFNTKGYAQ
jgi:hypothetical protein